MVGSTLLDPHRRLQLMRLPQYDLPASDNPVIGYFKLINLNDFLACINLGDYKLAKEVTL